MNLVPGQDRHLLKDLREKEIQFDPIHVESQLGRGSPRATRKA
jgi:hypothetical protein